ncbi:CGNR zinc finger domain-containing protein [Nakamurella sp. GG22]
MTVDDQVPAAARLIRDFVNTYEPQVDAESLGSPESLREWCAERDLMAVDASLEATDLALAVDVREGLRAVLLGHAGHAGDHAAIDTLNRALAEVPVRLTFTDRGFRLVGAVDTPFGHALGELAEAVRQAGENGSWHRLKVCDRDSCRWAFYDSSRNQVRRWCSMEGCGNHIKMKRAYVARKNRAAGQQAPARQS